MNHRCTQGWDLYQIRHHIHIMCLLLDFHTRVWRGRWWLSSGRLQFDSVGKFPAVSLATKTLCLSREAGPSPAVLYWPKLGVCHHRNSFLRWRKVGVCHRKFGQSAAVLLPTKTECFPTGGRTISCCSCVDQNWVFVTGIQTISSCFYGNLNHAALDKKEIEYSTWTNVKLQHKDTLSFYLANIYSFLWLWL